MTPCDQVTKDVDLLSTYWRCIPLPEQNAMWTLAQAYITPTQYVAVEAIKQILLLNGGFPVDERMDVMIDGLRLAITTDVLPDCSEETPCIVLALSPFVTQLAQGLTLPFYAIGGIRCQPCYYEKVMP